MTLPRKQIRDAVYALLSADATLSGLGWTFSVAQAVPAQMTDLPAGFVFTTEDSVVETMDHAPAGGQRDERRNLTVAVHLVASDSSGSNAQDDLDAAAEAIDLAIYGDQDFGLSSVYFTESVRADYALQSELERPTGTLTLLYRVTYENSITPP